MSDKLYCTYCGALNDAGSAFCGRCGHALEPLDVPAKEETAASDGQKNLLAALMAEPVTKIKEEPAPERRRPHPDESILDEQTQMYSRSELEAAIAASGSARRAEEAQKADELARQKERLIEESIRYYEEEKRERAEKQSAKMRREQEDALYADFEEPQQAAYGGQNGYGAGKYQNAAPPKKKKTWIPILIVLLLLFAASGFLGWKFLLNKTSVDLTRNIATQDITFQGYDGEGIVIYDEEMLRARADYPRGNKKAEEFMQTVSYTVEPATGLSNGDTVTVRAIVSDETAKSMHITVKGQEKSFEVNGLEEKPSIDWDPLNLFDDDKDEDKKDETKDTLIPEIDKRYYTDKDVQGKSKDQIQAMLNELYARHGYIFKDDTLKSQYEKQSWYKGTESDMAKVEQSFNVYEKKNLEYLTDVRSKL